MILGSQLKNAIISGSNNIAKHKKQVNDMNIFPVPDGDTGTNMSMTIGAAASELPAFDDDAPAGAVAKKAASLMLRGARGNSGVILSLLFRGISKGLEGKDEASAQDLVDALDIGVDEAYKAVMKPTEGTMLTVARVAAERAREALENGSDDPVAVWDAACIAGRILGFVNAPSLMQRTVARCLDAKADVAAYLRRRMTEPEHYAPPSGWYKNYPQRKPPAVSVTRTLDYEIVSRLLLRRHLEQQLADAPDVLTVEQIARFTGYTPHTVSRWCTEGRLRTIQRRPRFMVPKTWLLDYLVSDDYNRITRKSGKHYGMIQEMILKP